ncbi:MAG: hypothetical protein JKY34_11920 [Kordiimonadaceae bacterium]|nr:hypothetical protein [Kordiimonadaceae bacterium]
MSFNLRARLGSRAFFVATHTAVGGLVSAVIALAALIHILVAANLSVAFCLFFKELGELSKEAKLGGDFKNTPAENIALVKQAFSDPWIRAQWLYPPLILSAIEVAGYVAFRMVGLV